MTSPRKQTRNLTALVFLFAWSLALGQTKEICVTIDDLPLVSYGLDDTASQARVVRHLVNTLVANHIPAIGFVNESKLFNDTGVVAFEVGLLENWIDSGLEVGNHTFSHPDFNKVSCEEFFEDIVRGEKITGELLARKGKRIRYFRHPFLHLGNTKAKADSLEQYLTARGYRTAPVTIDNDDYLFARAYAEAKSRHDTLLVAKIGTDYLSYMEAKLLYFERQARALFGRDIPQILLIHASLLNAERLDSLVAMFRRNAYRFMSIDHVLEDPAYGTPVRVYGNWGISWIDRWALSDGKRGDFFKNEPVVPEYLR